MLIFMHLMRMVYGIWCIFITQQIADDFKGEIPFFRWMAKPVGRPSRPVQVGGFLVFALVFMGKLDRVAPIVTMFILLCFSALNFSCLLNALLERPSWRPTFRFYHWGCSALGGTLSVLFMFWLDWIFAVGIIIIIIIVVVGVVSTINHSIVEPNQS